MVFSTLCLCVRGACADYCERVLLAIDIVHRTQRYTEERQLLDEFGASLMAKNKSTAVTNRWVSWTGLSWKTDASRLCAFLAVS